MHTKCVCKVRCCGKAVRAALSDARDIEFFDLYESTPDLHGISQTPNDKRTFICGYAAYKKQDGKPSRVRFIYAHSDDPSLADYGPLNVEKPELNYGIRDESSGGRYATAFEFSGWNRVCANRLAEIEQLYDRHVVGLAILDAEAAGSVP